MCVWRVEANGEVDEVNRSWNFRLLVRREPFVLLSRYRSRLYEQYLNKKFLLYGGLLAMLTVCRTDTGDMRSAQMFLRCK